MSNTIFEKIAVLELPKHVVGKTIYALFYKTAGTNGSPISTHWDLYILGTQSEIWQYCLAYSSSAAIGLVEYIDRSNYSPVEFLEDCISAFNNSIIIHSAIPNMGSLSEPGRNVFGQATSFWDLSEGDNSERLYQAYKSGQSREVGVLMLNRLENQLSELQSIQSGNTLSTQPNAHDTKKYLDDLVIVNLLSNEAPIYFVSGVQFDGSTESSSCFVGSADYVYEWFLLSMSKVSDGSVNLSNSLALFNDFKNLLSKSVTIDHPIIVEVPHKDGTNQSLWNDLLLLRDDSSDVDRVLVDVNKHLLESCILRGELIFSPASRAQLKSKISANRKFDLWDYDDDSEDFLEGTPAVVPKACSITDNQCEACQ